MQAGVDLGGGQVGKAATAAARVIDDEMSSGPSASLAAATRGPAPRVGDVRLKERHRELCGDRLRASAVRDSALRRVVRRPALSEECGSAFSR
jgi:hypothetical protein